MYNNKKYKKSRKFREIERISVHNNTDQLARHIRWIFSIIVVLRKEQFLKS